MKGLEELGKQERPVATPMHLLTPDSGSPVQGK
jgi:hypothetical protein